MGEQFAKCVIKTDLLHVKFNTVYYIAKHAKAFTDYRNLLELQEKNNVQGISKNYITDRAAGVFTDVIGNSIKNDMKTAEIVKILFNLE